MERPRRRLTVITALDAAGYSELVRDDELRTLSELGTIYKNFIRRTLPKYNGKIIKTMGDGALIEFESVLDAVEWTMSFQLAMARRNRLTKHKPIVVRAAVVLADVIIADDDRLGAAVGFAERMQEAAPPGGIAITHSVRWQLVGEPATVFKPAGLATLRSIPFPVETWVWAPPGVELPELRPTSSQMLAPRGETDHARHDPRPLVVVLPFDDLSADASIASLTDGVVEEITATLSRLRDIRVVARSSAFTYKGRAVDVRKLTRELGVRYILEGSVRKAGNRLRVTAQFIEAESGAHLWSGRTDGEIDDIFLLQDNAASQIAGALQSRIRFSEIERAQRSASGSNRTRDLTLKAMPFFWTHRREDNAAALALLDEALAADARYGLALGLKGWCLSQQVTYLWSDNPTQDRALGLGFAERAAQTTDPDPLVFTAIGATLSILQEDQSRALMFIERALALDSTLSWAWTRLGYAQAYCGRAGEGLRSLDRAIALGPDDPILFNAFAGVATCHFMLGDYGEAVRWAQKALHGRPGMVWANRLLATSAAHAGDTTMARDAIAKLLAAHPALTVKDVVAAIHNAGNNYRERYADGLRQAGLPDG
jgi:adenylate cyclase